MSRLHLCKLLMAVLIVISAISSCNSIPKHLEFKVAEDTAKIWPAPPEKPRFRYVGTLYGEQNLNYDKSDQGWFSRFVRWVTGVDSANYQKKLILQRPNSGTVDSLGRILVTDISRHSVVVFDEVKGDISEWQLAGPETAFKTPVGVIAVEDGTYFVSDADLKLIIQLDADGNPIHSFGEDILQRPTGIARDPVRKQIYIADTQAHDIKVYSDAGFLLDVIGKWGSELGEFNAPTHLAFAKGKIYVTDTFNTRVQVLTPTGDFMNKFGQRGLYVGDLVRPKGVTVDSDGNIYVIESFHDYLLVYNEEGQFLMPVGGTGTEIGQFYLPSGVWADNNNKIYVADMFNGRIVVLQYLGGDKTSSTASLN